MQGVRTQQVKSAVVVAASAALAAAIAYACLSFGHAVYAQWTIPVGAMAGTTALIGFFLCQETLAAIGNKDAAYSVTVFDIAEINTMPALEAGELVLTDADRVIPSDAEPLELDDILTELSPNSRVVRLFDPRSMPTPGELGARIDRHLDGPAPSRPSADASQDLFDALAQLRRSLR